MPAHSLSSVKIYFRVNSGLRSQFTEWPAGSTDSMLSCKLNGQGSNPTRAIFQFNYSFIVGQLGLVGLGFSIRIALWFMVNFHGGKNTLFVFRENFHGR